MNNLGNQITNYYDSAIRAVAPYIPASLDDGVQQAKDFYNNETTQKVMNCSLVLLAVINPFTTLIGAIAGRVFKEEISTALNDITATWNKQEPLVKAFVAALALGLAYSFVAYAALSTLTGVGSLSSGTYFGSRIL